MANIETVRRDCPEHTWLWIVLFVFGNDESCVLLGSAAVVVNTNIAQAYVLDVITFKSGDDRCITRIGTRHDNVADGYSTDRSDCCPFRSTLPRAETNEDRSGRDIAHRYVRDRDVFHISAV